MRLNCCLYKINCLLNGIAAFIFSLHDLQVYHNNSTLKFIIYMHVLLEFTQLLYYNIDFLARFHALFVAYPSQKILCYYNCCAMPYSITHSLCTTKASKPKSLDRGFPKTLGMLCFWSVPRCPRFHRTPYYYPT